MAVAAKIPCNFINLPCSLDLQSTQEQKDLLVAELWEGGSTGISELGDTALCAFFDTAEQAQAMANRFGGEPKPADDRDWVSIAQESLQPITVGERFFLVPKWRNDRTPPGRFRIEVNNGLAFGTGAHETTRLCLGLLEKYVRPGMTVFDIGTGSGILSQAAKLLGAALVVGCDIDVSAVEIAAEVEVAVFAGSAPALCSGRADLVVANISPEAITEMAGEWTRLLKPGGYAILSGLELWDQVPVNPIETVTEGNWKALVVRKVQI